MKRLMLTALLFSLFFTASAQMNMAVVDTIKATLAKTKEPRDRIYLLGVISEIYISGNIPESDKYGEQQLREAELSRDRRLMFTALKSNGVRYTYVRSNKQFAHKALDFFQRAYDLAHAENLEEEQAEAQLLLASGYSLVSDMNKALAATTQATTIASSLKNDSLKAACQYSLGSLYQMKNEKINALRSYFNALRIAEEIRNPSLLRICYYVLAQFYADVKAYDKAIDYLKKSSEQLDLMTVDNRQYQRVSDMYFMGAMYRRKKSFDMAAWWFDRLIAHADSLSYSPLKMAGYNGLLSTYLTSDQPQKALEFFNNRTDWRRYMTSMDAAHIIDQAYGTIYLRMKRLDSAGICFARAEPGFLTKSPADQKYSFFLNYGDYHRAAGNLDKALTYYNRALAVSDSLGDRELRQKVYAALDTTYTGLQDVRNALVYSHKYYSLRDSLDKLGDESALLQMEMKDNEQREKRLAEERAAALERKHTVQYTGIAIGIAIIFTLLVLAGALRVSETMIKVIGFFAFILFFEFIILLADAKIHHWTHGEPLPVLGIKIFLIAILLPLHHWLEHKVVHYLTSKRLIIPSGKSLWRQISVRTKRIVGHSEEVK